MQSKHLTKTEYYKQNKLPIISLSRKLQSELPAMTHLLQTLPTPVPEIQKIHSKQIDNNNTNLELANALKIIHELEFELETMTSKFHQTQQELHYHQNDNQELSRQIQRNQQIIILLQSTIQKNEFSTKAKLQFEKDYNHSILIQYEKKIQDMNTAYDQLRNQKDKELLDAKIFHKENIHQVESRVQEFENQTQKDTKKLQKELQKTISLNSQFRKKLADLQSYNQEHIHNLEKTNTDLLQTNMRLKTQYQNKILIIQSNFDLSQNKNKELINKLKIFEQQIENNQNAWKNQKKCLIEQNLENQNIWKNSNNEISKQKEKILQEINKKTILLGEKEREEGNLKQKINTLERFISQLSQQKNKIIEDSERAKKQIEQTLLLDHHFKIEQIKLQNQIFISQEMKRVLDTERRSYEERYTTQITKYSEKIRILQTQKLQDSHSIRLSEDCSRKLQVKIDQMKIQIEYLNKQIQQYSESFQNKAKIMDEQFLYKLNNEQKRYSNEIDKLKTQKQTQQKRIKQKFDQNIKQLNIIIQQKSNEIRETQNKNKQLQNNFTNQKNTFILKIQQLQLNIDKYQSQYQHLSKLNENLKQKIIQIEDQCRSQETTAHQQMTARMKIAQELNSELQNVKNLKNYISQKQKQSTNLVGNLKTEIFDKKRKIQCYENQSQKLQTTISDYQFKLEILERQNKTLQQEKQKLQIKLIEKDTSSQENQKILASDLTQKIRRINSQHQQKQSNLQTIITQKQLTIQKQTTKIKYLQQDLQCLKYKYQHLNKTWKIICQENQQTNQKLLKSSFTVQDLEIENYGKDATLNNLLKNIKKYQNLYQNQKIQLTILHNQNFDLKSQIKKINFENQKLKNTINQIQNKYQNLQKQFENHKQKNYNQFTQLKQSQLSKIQQLQKWNQNLKQLQLQLQQTNEIYKKTQKQKQSAFQTIKILKKQQQQTQQKLKQSQKKYIQQISQFTNHKSQQQQIEFSIKQQFNQKINQQYNIINQNQQQLTKFSKILKQYENDLLLKIQQLEIAHKNLQQQKMNNNTAKAQIEQFKKEKIISQQKIENYLNEIEYLKKQKLTFERQLISSYEQNDKKLQQNNEQLTKHYNNLLRQKTQKVEDLSMKFSELSQKQRSQWHSRYQESHLQKQQYIRQLSYKNKIITDVKIQFDNLKSELEQKNKQLSLYKSKWALVFGNVQKANQSIENSLKNDKELNNQNIRLKKLQTRSQMQRTERSERTNKTSYGVKHSPQNYFKKPRQSTTFDKNRYERQFVNDFNENQKVEQEIDATKNEPVIFSKLTFNKQKQKYTNKQWKQNSSINSNSYASNQFDL